MTDVPIFGEKLKNVSYVERHAAYIIIENQQAKIMLVQAPNGAYFLPGGEIEKNETKEEAIHREVMEELGFTVEINSYLGQGDDFFYSRHRETHYHNPAYFYDALSWESTSLPLEQFNVVAWFSINQALDLLKRGSHKWAVETYVNQRKNNVKDDCEIRNV